MHSLTYTYIQSNKNENKHIYNTQAQTKTRANTHTTHFRAKAYKKIHTRIYTLIHRQTT